METLACPDSDRGVYWDEAEAVHAFEGRDPRIAGQEPWRARHALHEQLPCVSAISPMP